jgi:hypothetical protein
MTFTTSLFLSRDGGRRVAIALEGTGVATWGWGNNGDTWL